MAGNMSIKNTMIFLFMIGILIINLYANDYAKIIRSKDHIAIIDKGKQDNLKENEILYIYRKEGTTNTYYPVGTAKIRILKDHQAGIISDTIFLYTINENDIDYALTINQKGELEKKQYEDYIDTFTIDQKEKFEKKSYEDDLFYKITNFMFIEPVPGAYLEFAFNKYGWNWGLTFLLGHFSYGFLVMKNYDYFEKLYPSDLEHIAIPYEHFKYTYTSKQDNGLIFSTYKIGFRPNKHISVNYIFGRFSYPIYIDHYYSTATGWHWWSFNTEIEDYGHFKKEDFKDFNKTNFNGIEIVLRLNTFIGLKASYIDLYEDEKYWFGVVFGLMPKNYDSLERILHLPSYF